MLDFSARKQKLMDIRLRDETLLQLPVPKAALYDEILNVKAGMANAEIVPYVTKILNQNQQGIVYEAEQVAQLFDVAELGLLYGSYIKFVTEALNDPN